MLLCDSKSAPVVHVHEKNCWSVIRKSHNYNGDCAYAHGFPVLAEDPDVIVLRTYATNGDMSFCGEEPCLDARAFRLLLHR